MKRLVTSSLLVLFACITSLATTVERLTLDDMVRKANTIVHGRVHSRDTHWSADKRLILTTTTFDVVETIKGPGSRTIEVTTIGGKIGDLALYVPGMPSFEAGEEAVVFVEHSGAFSTVVGLSQGKFSVRNGEVANSLADLSFPDGRGNGAPLHMRLDDFKRHIQSRLRQ